MIELSDVCLQPFQQYSAEGSNTLAKTRKQHFVSRRNIITSSAPPQVCSIRHSWKLGPSWNGRAIIFCSASTQRDGKLPPCRSLLALRNGPTEEKQLRSTFYALGAVQHKTIYRQAGVLTEMQPRSISSGGDQQ